MSDLLTGIIIGMFVGVALGVLIMSLMAMAKRRSDQSWFWSKEWQEKEAEVDAHLKAGRYKTFYDVEDTIAYLDAPTAGDGVVAIRRLRDAD